MQYICVEFVIHLLSLPTTLKSLNENPVQQF